MSIRTLPRARSLQVFAPGREQACDTHRSAIRRGPLGISGTALGDGACWHVATDSLGWTTACLMTQRPSSEALNASRRLLDLGVASFSEPSEILAAMRNIPGQGPMALAKVSPTGEFVELVNAGLPPILHWDRVDGLALYEPALDEYGEASSDLVLETERLRMAPGSALVMCTAGFLGLDASWVKINQLIGAVALRALGGTLAEVAPHDLGELLHGERVTGDQSQPAAMLVLGLPAPTMAVA